MCVVSIDMAWLHQSRGSPRLVLVVVCVALLLDNMLLTVVGECSQQPRSMVHGLWSHGLGQGHMDRDRVTWYGWMSGM